MPISASPCAAFGAGTASSSDGQHFLTAGRGEAAGTFNARDGRDPAVSIYTHISDRYAPFHTKADPARRRSCACHRRPALP